jgi:hypothetical protein
MGLLETFRVEVEDFLDESSMTPTAFGIASVSDPNFVWDIRNGRAPQATTIDRVRAFIKANRPAPSTEAA